MVTIVVTPPAGATGIDLPVYNTDKSVVHTLANIDTVMTSTVTAAGNGHIYFTVDADVSDDVGTYSLRLY